VKAFLHNEVPNFAAVEMQWIGGRSPELFFLNKFGKVVATHDLAPMSEQQIREILAKNSIFTYTPKPEYSPPEYTPTKVCRAWRQTAGCDPTGAREAMADEACGTIVPNGRSGYCDCIGRPDPKFSCEHTDLTCENACQQSAAAGSAGSMEADDEEEEEEL
jgi:hypothetical protein